MIDKRDFIYRVQYENLVGAIDNFCNNELKRKRYNKDDIIISLNKILKFSYNNTVRLINIINEEDINYKEEK